MSTLSNHISLPVKNTLAKNILLSFLGSIAIAISAQITVPMFPVPMSMQTFAVLSIGMALGSRFGALAVIMYLAEGAMGLPVFAKGAFGIPYMLGTTGGYLFGYVIAAFAVGYLAERGWDKSVIKAFTAMLIGNALLYIPGVAWLGYVWGMDKQFIYWGFGAFIMGDLIKAGVASALFPMLWKKISKK